MKFNCRARGTWRDTDERCCRTGLTFQGGVDSGNDRSNPAVHGNESIGICRIDILSFTMTTTGTAQIAEYVIKNTLGLNPFSISNCLELGLTESGTVLGSICYTGFDSSYGRNQMLNLATLRAKAGIIVKFGKIGDNTDGLASRIFRFGLSPLQSGMEFMSENYESAQFIFLWLCK